MIKHQFLSDPRRPNLSSAYRAAESVLRNRSMDIIDSTLDPLDIIPRRREEFRVEIVVPRPLECRSKHQWYQFAGHTVETYWIDHRENHQLGYGDQILLYFHGGGYLLGDFQGFSGFGCHLSRYFNLRVIYLEYRLAPEYPLPAAVDDALTLYQALLHEGFSASHLAILGDSAGGGLALLTVQALLARHMPKPAAVITLSPWTDLSLSSPSHTRNRWRELMLSPAELVASVPLVLGPHHHRILRNDSSVSPVFGSFKNFPPMYIVVGGAEILEDDGRRVAEKAQDEGVEVTFVSEQHMMHVYPMFFSYFPEARDAIQNLVQWFRRTVAL